MQNVIIISKLKKLNLNLNTKNTIEKNNRKIGYENITDSITS